jgi:HEAT repeat protein
LIRKSAIAITALGSLKKVNVIKLITKKLYHKIKDYDGAVYYQNIEIIAAAIKKLPDAKKYVPFLKKILEKNVEINTVATTLIAIGTPNSIRALTSNILNENIEISQKCIGICGKFKVKKAIPNLCAVLNREQCYEIAFCAIAKIGDTKFNMKLHQIVQSSLKTENKFYAHAFVALGRLGFKDIERSIEKLTQTKLDEDTLLLAIETLGLIKSKTSASLLKFRLKLEQNLKVKGTILESLGRIVDCSVFTEFKVAIESNNLDFALGAVKGLTFIDHETANLLLTQSANSMMPSIRDIAIDELISRNDLNILNQLKLSAKSENHVLKEQAISKLGMIQDEESLNILIGALNDPLATIRRKAVQSLCKFKHIDAENAIISAQNDVHAWVREEAESHFRPHSDNNFFYFHDSDEKYPIFETKFYGERQTAKILQCTVSRSDV